MHWDHSLLSLPKGGLFDAGDETDAFFGHPTIGGIARQTRPKGLAGEALLEWLAELCG